MSELVAILEAVAWPLVALVAICAAIAVAYVFRHPMFAGERLDAAERRLAEHSKQLEEQKTALDRHEAQLSRAFDPTAEVVQRLRGNVR